MRNIVRISVDGIQNVYRDIQFFQFFLKSICTFLTGVLGDRNASHIQTFSAECLDQSQHIHIIGDTGVPADFIFFDIAGADNNNDFCLIRKLHQHLQFAVRCKTRQYTGCVVIIKKLSSKLQVELVVKLIDTFPDVLRLHG